MMNNQANLQIRIRIEVHLSKSNILAAEYCDQKGIQKERMTKEVANL